MVEQRNLSSLAFRLERFTFDLFKLQGFEVALPESDRAWGHDLMVDTGRALAVVEVKLYSSSTPASRNIIVALDYLERSRIANGAAFGILVTNSRLAPSQRSRLESFPALRVYDIDILAGLAQGHPSLAAELEEISRSALVFRGEDLPIAEPVDPAKTLAELMEGDLPELAEPEELPVAPPPEPPKRGADLCADIHGVGKSVAKPFEEACEAAVRWLFEDELIAFDDQHESHTGHNIFDLVARIASKEDFWQALISDFRARYIVFEFKNYSKPIRQREIYTTEKYLYPIAMRGAAIIVSRHGADAGADAAMRGALRESGKLILSLSVKELCSMLHARDAGSDHLATLVSKLDDMLMGLER
ncbi:hypothetical protein HNP52_000031 [Sphingomonas kyeonggiensis]|uniref:Restriction endonuclease type IV Mrr domain-containing protein n=1 Tax=Sphingomonas kyeonggiensis TaxID=1268553 RepID=A0A7W7JYA4_9SPHN|nr:restriction endonuclease [Sphingomonas kyeonggiensis]MBB4836980.1 hypothetical protein [Sphingomonas kyeonggiensis]